MPAKKDKFAPWCAVKIFNPKSKKKRAFDEDAACLFRVVEQYGSLSQAAKAIPMAYSKIWKLKSELEDAFGFKILDTRKGPRGSRLTKNGRRLL